MATKTQTTHQLTALSIDTVGDLDEGRTRAVIDKAIADAIADTEDRGNDGAVRKVKIQLSFERVEDHEVRVKCEVKTECPSYKTYPTKARVRQEGPGRVGARFSKYSPDNPDQTTMLDGIEEE